MEVDKEVGSESAFRITMADGLRPLAKVNFLLGVSSYTFSPSGHIQHPHKRFNRFRVFLSLIFISLSVTATVYQMIGTVLLKPIYSGVVRFNRMVELTCQILSSLNPLMLILISLFRINTLDNFFYQMGRYNAGISEFADPEKVRLISRKFFAMHLLLTAISGCLMVFHLAKSYDVGDRDPKLQFIICSEGNERLTVILNCIIVSILVLLKHSAIAFIECFNLQLATCFTRVIRNMTEFILAEADGWKGKYLGKGGNESYDPINSPYLSLTNPQQTTNLPPHPDNNPNKRVPIDLCSASSLSSKRFLEGATPGQQICYVIRKIHRVAKMQNVVNGLFGPVLALDMGFTVLMVVTLKYLLIRNVGWYLESLRGTSLMASMNSTVHDGESSGYHNTNTYMDNPDNSLYHWAFFLSFDLCFSLRLIVLTVCFGKVYNASVNFNCTLSKVLVKAQRVMDLLEDEPVPEGKPMQGQDYKLRPGPDHLRRIKCGCKDNGDIKRKLVTPTETDTILAFITSNTAHPIAFSAGGLFTFSNSTILFIVSIIISYVVFLLQA